LIGTSGWSYKEWEKIFYPNSKIPKLSYYASIFETAEIDSTFYAYPNKGLAIGWARNTPPGFEFSAKIPKLITHDKKLDLNEGVELDLQRFLDILAPVKDAKKLGALLIQLPPSFDRSRIEALKEFFGALPKGYRFAVEFRNKSWLKDPKEVYSLLEKYKVANTIVDEPLLPVDLTTTSDFVFVRWHGRGKRVWYDYKYSDHELEPWIERVDDLTSKLKKVYGYFNNHFNGAAVENSLTFLVKLGQATSKQKEILEQMRTRKVRGAELREEEMSQTKLS
jgi:uncharacterized protein YecE (DUF72 family)